MCGSVWHEPAIKDQCQTCLLQSPNTHTHTHTHTHTQKISKTHSPISFACLSAFRRSSSVKSLRSRRVLQQLRGAVQSERACACVGGGIQKQKGQSTHQSMTHVKLSSWNSALMPNLLRLAASIAFASQSCDIRAGTKPISCVCVCVRVYVCVCVCVCA